MRLGFRELLSVYVWVYLGCFALFTEFTEQHRFINQTLTLNLTTNTDFSCIGVKITQQAPHVSLTSKATTGKQSEANALGSVKDNWHNAILIELQISLSYTSHWGRNS